MTIIHRTALENVLPNAAASWQFEGGAFGDVPISFFWTDAPPGTGPGLHQHRYAEIFVLVEGGAAFTVGSESLEAASGQIVVAPAGVRHAFANSGPVRSCHIDIHPASRMNGETSAAGKGPSEVRVIERPQLPHGPNAHRFEGGELGDLPVSFFWTDAAEGTGPGLHRHPYAEVFVVLDGGVIFTIGEERLPATAGHIVIAPAGVPHQFVNSGPGRSRHLDLHPSPRIITEWIETGRS